LRPVAAATYVPNKDATICLVTRGIRSSLRFGLLTINEGAVPPWVRRVNGRACRPVPNLLRSIRGRTRRVSCALVISSPNHRRMGALRCRTLAGPGRARAVASTASGARSLPRIGFRMRSMPGCARCFVWVVSFEIPARSIVCNSGPCSNRADSVLAHTATFAAP
jgi:hypothetical protein